MRQANLCFSKVKKDCIKFIKSQETSTEKFKGKEKMIKSFFDTYLFLDCQKSKE